MPKSADPKPTEGKLTKEKVDGIFPDPGGADVFRWDEGDGAIKGFGVRMKPSGAASFVVQYRTPEGRTRRLALGRVGVLTADQARKLAAARLSEVAHGRDPSAERRAAREALTVAEVAELYLCEGPAAKPNKKASSWAADVSNIERHVKPLLGRKLAKMLTPADVARFQADVAAGKSKADVRTGFRGRAIVEGGKGTAARSLAVLGAMLQFAVDRQLIASNPAKGVKLYKGEKKERFLSEAEVARLADTLASMERDYRLSPTAAAAIRLLMLTGARKSEILGLRWAWIDFDRGCLRLPDGKTGAKTVPLASAALALLSDLRQEMRSDFVLPAAKGGEHFAGLQKAWEWVRIRAELPGVRLHDLRHSFASFAIADGNTLFMVGKVLGHKQARTTETYAHLADDPVRAVADRTGARIAAAMKGSGSVAEIIPLRRLDKGIV
jgi:integrase